jgi:predicted AAA+ superfamily ATPase
MEIHETAPSLLVLDEIQCLRDWDQWLKVFVDSKHGAGVLATGSSSEVSEECWAIESGVFKELFREYVQKGGFPGVIRP